MRLGRFTIIGAALVSLFAGTATAATLDFQSFAVSRTGHKVQDVPLREGDFDNDGRLDQVLILPEAETGRFEIQIRFNAADGAHTQRVMTIGGEAFAPDSGMELHVVPAGRYTVDCGDFSDGCQADVIDASADSLRLSMNGASVLMYWNGDRFVQDFVKAEAVAPELATDRVLNRAVGLLGALGF